MAALGGAAVTVAVDRSLVADAVRDGSFNSAVLTEDQALDGLVGWADWSGIRLAPARIVTVLLGVVLAFSTELAIALLVVIGLGLLSVLGTPSA